MPPKDVLIKTMNTIGPMMWTELHKRALEFSQLNLPNDNAWLCVWIAKLPVFSKCKCNMFWDKWIVANPPTFDNYFEWTVRTHNAVNQKLGKKQMTIEEATKKWSA